MLKIKNIIYNVNEVPSEWVFEHYLGLETLSGQDVKIKSLFNENDKNPSMFVYYDVNSSKYKFKDFSSGAGGDGVELIMRMFNFTERSAAAQKIVNDYIDQRVNYKPRDIIPVSKHKVIDYKIRKWNNIDKLYWNQYLISSKTLEKYKVLPIEKYTSKNEEEEKEYKFDKSYGFFKNNGDLYKIYNPGLTIKFIEVTKHLQGLEQLNYSNDIVIWMSSLKDIMALESCGLKNISLVAPESENRFPSKEMVDEICKKFKYSFVMYDNDKAGIKSMKEFRNEFGIDYLHLKLCKDVSDSIKQYGRYFVKKRIIKLIKNQL